MGELMPQRQRKTWPRPKSIFAMQHLSLREQIVGAMFRLSSLLGSPMDAPRAEGYADSLDSLPADSLTEAFGRAERECERMPTVAQLRALARDDAGQIQTDWCWIMKQIPYSGIEATAKLLREPEYSRLRAVCEFLGGSISGGLKRISETQPSHYGLLRADFERAWGSIRVNTNGGSPGPSNS